MTGRRDSEAKFLTTSSLPTGRPEPAAALESAVDEALQQAPTRDLGGDAKMQNFLAVVLDRLG